MVNVAKPTLQTFGKYQILQRIATGGMAEIYKAKLEGIGGFQRTFAIKRILPNLSQNSEYIAMLVDEAKVAGLLSHANIVQILDLGQVDGIWYIAMEYVDGRDLGAVLRRAQEKGLCLPVPHTVFIAIELLKGLEYAHGRQVMRGGRPVALNIIHRDVSPPNVLLSFQGEVKLTDFGIARASLKAMETVSGIVKGRFDYMSPEQAAGSRDLDQRSDLFTVGVVLYEMLTGHHPFRTDNEIGTIERVRSGKYVPVSQRNPDVPFTLETVVDRALQVDREDRYPSATAFKEALDKFFHDAGFIFTHATLASYVKGLFTETSNQAGATPALQGRRGNQEHTPLHSEPITARRGRPNIHSSLQDLPTNSLDRRAVLGVGEFSRPTESGTPPTHGLRPGPPETDPTAIRPSPLVPTAPDEDQETLIRRMPDGWEDEVATNVRPQMWDDDQETVIRKIPDDLLEPMLNGTGTPLDPIHQPEIHSATFPAAPPPARIGWLGWLLTTLGLFTGLSVGSVLALLLAVAAGFQWEGASGAAAQPQIRVVAPADAKIQVKLNGDSIGTEFQVPPNTPQRIEISLDGHQPFITELTCTPGEYRAIVVSPIQLKPAPRKQKK